MQRSCQGSHKANSGHNKMATLLSNDFEDSFFISSHIDHIGHTVRSFPSVPQSSYDRQHCIANSAVPHMMERSCHGEYVLSEIEPHFGLIKRSSLGMRRSSLCHSMLSQTRQQRRRPPLPPTSNCINTLEIPNLPYAIKRDPRREKGWLKARVQHERDQIRTQRHVCEMKNLWGEGQEPAASIALGPARKQSDFVKEEHFKFSREDRAGTPHSSELHADNHMVAPSTVEELSMGGEAGTFAGRQQQYTSGIISGH